MELFSYAKLLKKATVSANIIIPSNTSNFKNCSQRKKRAVRKLV
ncbi:hypothetical protein [Flavobacterium panacagri]|nr:hypothetical protein [Flavobacterium panacagri]